MEANRRTAISLHTVGVALFLLAIVAGIVGVVLREMLRLPEVPALQLAAPSEPRTGHKLLFVVADALRYDYATDPQRAPNIARHMRQHTHGELWAGRITMTSAAVLAMGTGQRGDFAEVITNLHAGRTRFDDFVNSARRAGLTTGLVGDEVWKLMFGSFQPELNDASGMAIDVDNSPQMFAAAAEILEREPRPDLLVVHLIATDHQGHAHGMASSRYAQFLKRFDADMEALLQKVPADTAVMFMSDHGATDTGAHGSDIPIARRSPFFAYGPGIRRGVDLGELDQIDLGPTVAALLGVPAPRHARGTVITELLDVSEARAGQLACADARRASELAAAQDMHETVASMREQMRSCAEPGGEPAEKVAGSRAAVRTLDADLELAQSLRGTRGALAISLVLAALLLVLALSARRVSPAPRPFGPRWAVLALAMCALSVVLTFQVERITPPWHNVTRAVLFAAAGIALLVGLLRPNLGVRFYERTGALGWVLLPGALAWSYTANTQVMSWVLLAVGAVLLAFGLDAERRSGWLSWARRTASAADLLVVAGSLVFLLPFAIHQDEPLASGLTNRPGLLLGLGLAAMTLWLLYAWKKVEPRPPWWTLALAIALTVSSLLLRRFAPSPLGIGALFVLPAVSAAALLGRRPVLAMGAGLGAWAWVSRDHEVLPLVACLAIAEVCGRILASRPTPEGNAPRNDAFTSSAWISALAVTVLFCLSFLVRVGLQRGLDFPSMDFGAGSFGDPGASSFRIGAALTWKYVAGELVLIVVFLWRASARDRRCVLLSFAALSAIRGAAIASMLFVGRGSYWTAFRTLSDQAPALCTAAAAAFLLALWSARGSAEALDQARS
jgi:hypothetical protein